MSAPDGGVERGRWKRRALAILLGLALTPLVLEGALRFAGLFLEGSRAGAAGEAAILCQGDSFTFGLYLPPETAYPARLEQLLQAQGNPAARVINAGIPSKPTWIVKQELRADLRRWRPRVVVLLAGVNNHWRKRPEDHAVEVHGPAPRPWRIVTLSQWFAARLARERDDAATPTPPVIPIPEPTASPAEVADHGITNWIPTTAVKQRPGVQEVRFRDRSGLVRGFEILAGAPSAEESCSWIEEDLTTAVAIAREEGVVPVLMAYPARGGTFDSTNAALRRVAESTDTLFVDPRPEFDLGLRKLGSRALYFPDSHATDMGCALMARVALRELAVAGLVRVDAVPPPLSALEGWVEPTLKVRLESAPEGKRPTSITVEYAPGYGAVLLLARARGATNVDFPGLGNLKQVAETGPRTRTLPLADDALLARTLAGNQFRTITLGPDGRGTLAIPWELVDADGDITEVLGAVAVVLPKVGPVIAVSESLTLAPAAASPKREQ